MRSEDISVINSLTTSATDAATVATDTVLLLLRAPRFPWQRPVRTNARMMHAEIIEHLSITAAVAVGNRFVAANDSEFVPVSGTVESIVTSMTRR